MLLKCCPQSVSRFVKLRSGRGQFSLQSQRMAMPKNVQTTIQLCSFQMLARFCSKFFRLGLSSTWTKNMHCMWWVSKRQRNQRSNCHHSLGCGESKGVPGKKSTFASLTMLKALTVWISTNWKILKEMRVRDHLACLLRNLYTGQKANGELDLEPPTGSKQKGVRHGCVASPAYLTLCRARHVRCGPGWMASWIRISWRNINSLTHAEDTTLM